MSHDSTPASAPAEKLPPSREDVSRERNALWNGLSVLLLMCVMFFSLPVLLVCMTVSDRNGKDDIEQLMPAFVGLVQRTPEAAQSILSTPALAPAVERLDAFEIVPHDGRAQMNLTMDSTQCGHLTRWLVDHPVLTRQLRITNNGSVIAPDAVADMGCWGAGGKVVSVRFSIRAASP